MAKSRLGIRLDEQIKSNAKKAALLSGHKSLTDYVTNLIIENSTKVIDRYEFITVENGVFDRFIEACEKVSKPNSALTDAVKYRFQPHKE
ncbi:MAG: hypothetical protein B0W54_06875 [Cellvibrio sp. 79]|nr:MAG: hypothetical protein B0W54_06875 [Cellvibrio sp. 79]